MKSGKRVVRMVMAFVMALSLLAANGWPGMLAEVNGAEGEEQTLPVSGTSNDVEWSIDENGHLEISGSGDWERPWGHYAPWWNYSDDIISAKVTLTGATDLSYMFCDCRNLAELDVSGFSTGNVTNMGWMFWNCANLTELDVSGFDTRNVTEMGAMFCRCASLTELDVSGFSTENVMSMGAMFGNCANLIGLDVSGFSTENVTSMNSMFSGCTGLTELDVSGFDTGNVKNMRMMFYECANLTELDVSGFDTRNVTDMYGMFWDCAHLTELDVSRFDTRNVTEMRYMFDSCANLTELDVSGFSTENVTDMEFMFRDCANLTELDVSGFSTGNVTTMNEMFWNCANLTELDVSGFSTGNVTDMEFMFRDCANLTELDVNGFSTGNVTNMYGMFDSCANLTELDVSGFDTENVTDIGAMFSGCAKLTDLDVRDFKTGNVTDMYGMFSGCAKLTELDVSGFETENVTNMVSMFNGCTNLTELDVSSFDTRKVTDMYGMFSGCAKLTELDVSGFDTRNVADMSCMFMDCVNLTELDVSGFDTRNVTNMEGMFDGCESLTELDVRGFDTGNVTDMKRMFRYCENLTELDMSGFDSRNVTDMEYMFSGCNSLISINTPVHVKIDCDLTGNGIWKDEDGNVYTMLPQNLDSGIYIYKINYTDLVAEAKAVVEETLSKITADNGTTREDIQEEVDRALTTAEITDVTVTVGELSKTEATDSEAGSITGSIIIEAGNEWDSVVIEKEIAKLPETQPDEDTDFADLVAKAKAVVEETLSKITAGNDTTREDIQEEVDRALTAAGITDVAVTVGELTKKEATESETGSITGNIAIEAGNVQDSVAIDKEIAKLPETQPDEDTDLADLVAKAKAVVEETLSKITAGNDTTREDIQEEVDRALTAAGIKDVTVTVGELTKTEATESETGSITGSIVIEAGNERDSVAIEKEIAKLPETQPDEDTDLADLVAKAKAVVEETLSKITAGNDTTREDIQEEVDRALTAAGITDVAVTVGELTKKEATESETGSITGNIAIEAGNVQDSVAIDKEIAKLPETQPDEDTDLFDKENEVSTEIEPSPDAEGIPEEDRITSITINPAFNMKHKGGDDVELDLTKITIKANEIYDEEGLRRAEEALGETISGNKHYNLLDLTLLYDGKDFSNGYEGLVQVIIPLPAGHRDKTFSCYRLTEVDGKMVKEPIPGVQTEDSYIIYLEHFSEYALVADGGETEETTKPSDSTTPVTPSAPSDDGKQPDVSGNPTPNAPVAPMVTATSPETGDTPMTGAASGALGMLMLLAAGLCIMSYRKARGQRA